MIDPTNFTNYDLDDAQLEEYVLFGIVAAGKNAMAAARGLEKVLRTIHDERGGNCWRPFETISRFTHAELVDRLKAAGIGCYNLRARGFLALANAGLDLRTCTPEALERIPGIKYKTSRLFVLHTRPGARVACLDVHILKYLRACGYQAPAVTPQSRRKYLELEKIFLELARQKRMSPARLDLKLWREYSGNPRKAAA